MRIALMYRFSTFFLAHSVFRRKVKLEFTLGSCAKQLIRMRLASPSQPYLSTKYSTINFKVLPSNGSMVYALSDSSNQRNSFSSRVFLMVSMAFAQSANN